MAELELVVVDDASPGAGDVARAVAELDSARLVRHEAPRGPAAARNTGAREAAAPIVLFTDDDCEPAPDWAERLLIRLEAGSDAAGGVTVNALTDNAFARASQLIAGSLRLPLGDRPESLSFSPTSNLACRADLIAAIPFDEAFLTAAGEDREWCARFVETGHVIASEPTAVVRHRHQLTLSEFWRQHVRYGQGAQLFRSRHAARLPFSFYARLLGQGFAAGPLTGAAVCIAQTATALGYARARFGGQRGHR